MVNVSKVINKLINHNVRRVFHILVNNPDLNLAQISSTLNLSEESVRKILKQLEEAFPNL